MAFSLLPRMMVPKLTDLTPELLQGQGIGLLLLDFDNTVLPYTSNEPQQALLDWFAEMKRAGIRLCVVSNSKKSRAIPLCEAQGIDIVLHAKKPFPKGIREALARFDAAPETAALVGDQIFTDVLGANCAGVRSILVKPIHLHNIWLKLRHGVEQPFILLSKNRRIKK